MAYDIAGAGPLIVCIPGMGDLRAAYRFLQPELVAAGYRVAVMDLRGHGDSDATFTEYGDQATASDVTALIQELGAAAIVVGSSMGAGSAVLVASGHPELVSGLVLIGPFVRDPKTGAFTRVMTRAAMTPLWAAAFWKSYVSKLYAGTKPADFAEYRTAVAGAIKRPGYAKAFSKTTRTSHSAAEQALATITAPALVVMGEQDPDFPAPETEARWIAERLNGELLMVPDAGHYPQSQQPELVTPAIQAFAARVARHA